MTIDIRCRTHPRYQAKGRPKGDCMACNKMWELKLMQQHEGISPMLHFYNLKTKAQDTLEVVT
jgi:hypothetical protein